MGDPATPGRTPRCRCVSCRADETCRSSVEHLSPSPIWSARSTTTGRRRPNCATSCTVRRRAAVPGQATSSTPTCFPTPRGPSLRSRRPGQHGLRPGGSPPRVTRHHRHTHPGVLAETSRPRLRPDPERTPPASRRRRLPARQPVANTSRWTPTSASTLHGAPPLSLVGFRSQIRASRRQRATRFGIRVLFHDPDAPAGDASPVGMDELLRDADIVSLHVPLTPATGT
ncbi:hypothetical protein HBB16_07605 [Pseudonocardia sp. MCCB 268]|nr:hypothetical protein [Pseudonocardia cytotoxica]